MSATPPAGWYPDPSDATAQRYWDGAAWTNHVAPGQPVQPPADAPDADPAAVDAAGGAAWPAGDPEAAGSWGPGGAPPGGTVSTWTWQAFVVTLLCGGTFISMIGIYNAGKAEAALESGDVGQAQVYARRARNWTLGGLAFGVLIVGLVVASLIAAAASLDGLADECAQVTRDDPFMYGVCEAYCQDDQFAPGCEEFGS